MRRMFSENQLKELIEEYGLTEEDVVEMLVGKYVKIINASDIPEPLTQEFINENFAEGFFVNGIYKGYKNPVFFPCILDEETYNGMAILPTNGSYRTAGDYQFYYIDNTKVLKFQNNKISFSWAGLGIQGLYNINNKNIPSYPSNTGTFTLKCVNGTLTWVADE